LVKVRLGVDRKGVQFNGVKAIGNIKIRQIMKTVVINHIEDGIQPPTGNGFQVFIFNLINSVSLNSLVIVDTGLDISLPNDCTLEVKSLIGFQMDWSLSSIEDKGRLLLRTTDQNLNRLKEEKKPIAKVWIVKREVEKIRFMEKSKDGGVRVIKGEGKSTYSFEIGSSERGED
jgi:hypothetical protein